MNAKLLDSQLRKLTDEEIEARDGKEKDYSGFQFIEDSGKNYFLMTKGENIYHPYISFMPHTRFIPVKPHVHEWIELGYMWPRVPAHTADQWGEAGETGKGQGFFWIRTACIPLEIPGKMIS